MDEILPSRSEEVTTDGFSLFIPEVGETPGRARARATPLSILTTVARHGRYRAHRAMLPGGLIS